MLKVEIARNEVKPAIKWLLVSLRPSLFVKQALHVGKRLLKQNYTRKWRSQGIHSNSFWQDAKNQAGFSNVPGVFTGSTLRAIDYRMLKSDETTGQGEISLYGKWPDGVVHRVGYFGWKTEKGGNMADFVPSDTDENLFGMNPEDILELKQEMAEKGVSDISGTTSPWDIANIKLHGSVKSTGVIAVGPNKVVIRYPNSKPMVKHSQPMRTMRYAMREGSPGKAGQTVDFMYLHTDEINDIFGSAVETISTAMSRRT